MKSFGIVIYLTKAFLLTGAMVYEANAASRALNGEVNEKLQEVKFERVKGKEFGYFPSAKIEEIRQRREQIKNSFADQILNGRHVFEFYIKEFRPRYKITDVQGRVFKVSVDIVPHEVPPDNIPWEMVEVTEIIQEFETENIVFSSHQLLSFEAFAKFNNDGCQLFPDGDTRSRVSSLDAQV